MILYRLNNDYKIAIKSEEYMNKDHKMSLVTYIHI